MAHADDDDAFLHVFAKGKRAGKTIASTSSGASAPVEPVRLLPPQRRINSARRAHEAAVKTLVRRHDHVREMAVSGVAAADQATQRELSPGAVARTRAAVAAPPPLPEMSLQDAYESAVALETQLRGKPAGGSSDDVKPADVLKAWQLLYGVAAVALKRPGSDAQAAYRAQMTALSRQSVILESQGSLRAAIRALEVTVDLSDKVGREPATLRMCAAVLRRTATLHASVGSIDAARRCLATAAGMEHEATDGVAPAARADVEPPPTPAAAPVAVPVDAPAAAVPAAAPQVEAVPQPPTPAAAEPDTAAAAAPAPLTLPVYDASDMSADAVLSRALVAAMFSNNFDPLIGLLNKALLGDAKAVDALKTTLKPLDVTPLMVAASADRPDVVRRIIASLPRSSVVSHVLTMRDVSGHTAIAHAVVRSAARALDELLRALNSAGFSVPSAPPDAAATPAAQFAHACTALGIPGSAQGSMQSSVEDQLRMFTRDADAYVREFRPPVLVSTLTPPPAPVYTPPPLPAGPPPTAPFAAVPPALAYALNSMAWAQAAALMAALAQASPAPPLPAGPAPPRTAAPAAAAPAAARSTAPASRKTPLQPYVAPAMPVDAAVADVVATPLDEEAASRGTSRGAGWDQFGENARLFGVTASFPAEKYNSRLDMGAFTPEQVAAADAIAAAIAGDDGPTNAHVREERQQGRTVGAAGGKPSSAPAPAGAEPDEETKFSSVARAPGSAAAAADTFTDAAVTASSTGSHRGRGRGGRRGGGRGGF